MTGRIGQAQLALQVRRLRRRPPAPLDQRLADLRAHAVARSPFYRRHHAGLEDAPLRDLPPLTKDHLVESFDDVVTDDRVRLADIDDHLRQAEPGTPFRGRFLIGVTSGSSGRPGVVAYDRQEWPALIANAARSREVARRSGEAAPAGRVRAAKIGSTLGWHLSAQVATAIADPRTPALRLSAATPLDELVAQLGAWQPDILTAYPSILGLLAHESLAGRLDLAPRQVFAGAELLTDDVRRRVRSAWGVEVVDQYAIGEAGFLAVECEAGTGLHVMDDHVVLEVVDDEGAPVAEDEEGTRALVTVLAARTTPLIRYELGDRLRRVPGPCPCGRTAPRIRVGGRARDVLWFEGRKGKVAVHPVALTGVMDVARVRSWQAIREPEGLRVLVADPAAEVRLEELAATIRRGLGALVDPPPPVTVEAVETIDRGPGGKASLVVDRT